MYNSVLRALMQTFLMTSISMWYSLRTASFESGTEITDFVFAILTLLATLFFPAFAYMLLIRKEGELPKPTFRARFDSLYQNLDVYKKAAYSNTSLFLLRRLLFAFTIVMCEASIVLQVGMADLLSTALLGFYLSVMPMTDGLNNFIQIFNEVIVLIAI